jgi:Zn-dependent protease
MNTQGIMMYLLFAVLLFICVVLHEFGHALTARRFGIETKDIVLLPLGGLARLTGMPDKPLQELLIAVAGPAVNLVLMIVFAVLIFFVPGQSFLFEAEMSQAFNKLSNFLPLLFWLNAGLAIFNMVPAYPMDGGRVLRALLSFSGNKLMATRIATIVGQIIAALFIIYGAYTGQIILAFIGLFVMFTAGWEYRVLRSRYTLESNQVSDIMRKDFTRIEPSMHISEVVQITQLTGEKHFIVTDQSGMVIGVLHGLFLQDAISSQKFTDSVAAYMSPRFEFIRPDLTLFTVYKLMQEKGYSILPVVNEAGQLTGVVDREDLKRASGRKSQVPRHKSQPSSL